MANMCAVDMHITCMNPEGARKVYVALQRERREAKRDTRRMFIGSDETYLECQDLQLVPKVSLIDLYGEVRWGLSYSDMRMIVKWLKSLADIQMIRCRMEGDGDELFGDYYYEGDKLTYRHVPYEHFPVFNPDHQSYYDDLEEALKKHGVTEDIDLEGNDG